MFSALKFITIFIDYSYMFYVYFMSVQIGIWEDRKVFVSRGPLKEEFLGRHEENHNKNEKPLGFRLVI